MKDINNKMVIAALVLAVLAVLSVIFAIGFKTKDSTQSAITSFLECETAGFPVMESSPRQCIDSLGNHFVEDVANVQVESKKDLIVVDSPKLNATVKSPITISGKARGYWFFEASFPVEVVDWDGKIIGSGIAQAQGEWMTEGFVPFTATINYTLPNNIYSKKGAIILKKDNPSGEPQNDDALEIPIVFE
jgi:hypothetical protein